VRRTVSLKTAILTPLAVAATVLVAASGAVGPGAPFAQAGGQNRAVVIVDTGSSVRAACVLFSEDSISGAEALQRAGMSPVFQGYSGLGGAVCSLNGVGCPSDGSCLTCQAPSYWQYWRSNGGGFAYSGAGASSTSVTDGSVEGWSWGGTRTAPPFQSVDAVCGAEAPPATSPPETRPPGSGGGGGTGGGGSGIAAGGSAGGPAAGDSGTATTATTAAGETTTTTDAARAGDDGASTSGPGGGDDAELDPDGEAASSVINDVDDGGSPVGSIALSTGVLGGIGFFVWRARRRNHAGDPLDEPDAPRPGGA
jgi:hypothetical protein